MTDTPTPPPPRRASPRDLFRAEVAEAGTQRALGEVRLALPVSHRVWALSALVCTALLLGWMFLGEYTRRERVSGVLLPPGGYANLRARAAGDVIAVHVREGQSVKRGEVLLEVDSEQYVNGEEGVAGSVSSSIEVERGVLHNDRDRVKSRYAAERAALDVAIRSGDEELAEGRKLLDMLELDARRQAELLERMKPAEAAGYLSATQVQQQRSAALNADAAVARQRRDLITTGQRLRELRTKLEGLPRELAQEIDGTERELAKVDAALQRSEGDRRTVVRSPVDGVVASVMVRAGRSVNAGSALATIVPPAPRLDAELLVRNSAVGFVKPGSTVFLHYRAFPYQKFGVYPATVESVSLTPLTPAEIAEAIGVTDAKEPMYRVRAALKDPYVNVYGRQVLPAPGMAVDGDILLDRRRIFEWIFEPLYAARRKAEQS